MKGRSLVVPQPVGDGTEIARAHVFRQLRRDAERVERFEQHLELLLLGLAVHAIQRADAPRFELARHRDVREDHALLDEFVRLVALVHVHALDAARGIDVELRLGRVEFERAALVAMP